MRVRDAHRYWTGAMPDADFRERRKAEVQLPRTPLLRTRVNNLFGECARLSSPAVSLEGGPQRRLATSAGTAGRIVSALSYPPHAPGKHQQADTQPATSQPPPEHQERAEHARQREHHQQDRNEREGHPLSPSPSRGTCLACHPLWSWGIIQR